MANHKPTDKEPVRPDQFAEARAMGMQHFHVVCVNPADDADAVSFSAYGPYLPRAGDRLDLEDGTVCQVTKVLFGFSRGGTTKFPSYVPNVYAERVGKIRPHSG